MTVIDTIKDKLHHHHDKHAAAATTQTPPTPVSPETETSKEAPDVKFSDTPVFDANKITVIFVLGGPGAGTSSVRLRPHQESVGGGGGGEGES